MGLFRIKGNRLWDTVGVLEAENYARTWLDADQGSRGAISGLGIGRCAHCICVASQGWLPPAVTSLRSPNMGTAKVHIDPIRDDDNRA